MISEDLKAKFEAVIREFEAERATVHSEVANLQRKLREIDQTITSLYRKVGTQPPTQPATTAASGTVAATIRNTPSQKYAFISVHWAILHLLSEAPGPMTTSEIAEALTAAGVKTKAANFANNVSAVLSTNMRPKGEEEVEAIEGKWRLTEIGRNKITYISGSAKFRQACPWIVGSTASAA